MARIPGWRERPHRTGSTGRRAETAARPMVPANIIDITEKAKTETVISVTNGKSIASNGMVTMEIPLPALGWKKLKGTITTGTIVLVPMGNGATMANGKVVITANSTTGTAIPVTTMEKKPHLRRHRRMHSSEEVSNFVNLINHIQSPYK